MGFARNSRQANCHVRCALLSSDLLQSKGYSDATLMTNRFHFAVQDGPLEEKSSVLGWYQYVVCRELS